MRFGIILAAALCAAFAAAQSGGIWSQVSTTYNRPQTPAATLSDAQQKAVSQLLHSPGAFGDWDCPREEVNAAVKNARYEWIPVSDGQNVLLVESPAGCARGGQGANGAMWLILFRGGIPTLIASPKLGFSGWLFAIQPTASHGLCDIVLGWHMGARESGLNYFRFDGNTYQSVGSATLTFDENENGKIEPNPAAK